MEPRLCRDQCDQYISSVRETLIDSSLCSQSPSRGARTNRASILSPTSSLKSLCSQLPRAPSNAPQVPPANVGICNRGTDDEFTACGFENDNDIQKYCKSLAGKNDSCCPVAMNEALKRVIPKTVNPATDEFWIITGMVVGGVLLLGTLAWMVTILTNWKTFATPASRPNFRKSIPALSSYKPTFTEKKLALDKLGDEKYTFNMNGAENAYFDGDRKSVLVDAMRGRGLDEQKIEGEDNIIIEDSDLQYEDDENDSKPNVLQDYEDQDFVIN